MIRSTRCGFVIGYTMLRLFAARTAVSEGLASLE